MLTINTNTTSLTTQMNLSKSNSLVKTSIERMSTGFKINRASDDAANMSISKSMNCQISGTEVALENSKQAINLLQTADGALDNMQSNLQRIRELTVEALNGTYSSEEKQMIQAEIDELIEETYKQRNSTMFNEIKIFGEDEEPPSTDAVNSTSATTSTTSTTAVGGTHEVTKLTEEEAIAQGYTCIHDASEFAQIKDNTSGKYCLMGDINFSEVSGWGTVSLQSGGELNGNGYAVNNYTSTSNGLFLTSNGTIKNLSMNNVNICSTCSNVGAIAGSNNGTIDNCSVSGTVTGGDYTGGLVGGCSTTRSASSTITNCSASGTVTGGDYTGGLVGGCSTTRSASSTITNCSASGTVTGGDYTGGLVGGTPGYEASATITGCSSSATVTGTSETGGLVGGCKGAYSITQTIINCSSSGTVTGTGNAIGGLVGQTYGGEIDKSYSTGDVSGTNSVGGLIGFNGYNKISNSYAMGDVSGCDFVGGLTGKHSGSNVNPISSSYATGTVTGTGSNVGSFTGACGTQWERGFITNSYSSSELNFYGSNLKGTISDCHGTTTQDGVTAHDASWFEDSSNLSFLGSAYDYSINPPDIIGNERPPEPDPQTSTSTVFQIGANSGEENTLTIDTGFSMGGYYADVTTVEAGQKTLVDTDNILNKISSERSKIGAMQNRLESVTQSLSIRGNNLEASHSTIVDTDYAAESSKLVKNQILQSVASSLLAQANTTPEIALQLLT